MPGSNASSSGSASPNSPEKKSKGRFKFLKKNKSHEEPSTKQTVEEEAARKTEEFEEKYKIVEYNKITKTYKVEELEKRIKDKNKVPSATFTKKGTLYDNHPTTSLNPNKIPQQARINWFHREYELLEKGISQDDNPVWVFKAKDPNKAHNKAKQQSTYKAEQITERTGLTEDQFTRNFQNAFNERYEITDMHGIIDDPLTVYTLHNKKTTEEIQMNGDSIKQRTLLAEAKFIDTLSSINPKAQPKLKELIARENDVKKFEEKAKSFNESQSAVDYLKQNFRHTITAEGIDKSLLDSLHVEKNQDGILELNAEGWGEARLLINMQLLSKDAQTIAKEQLEQNARERACEGGADENGYSLASQPVEHDFDQDQNTTYATLDHSGISHRQQNSTGDYGAIDNNFVSLSSTTSSPSRVGDKIVFAKEDEKEEIYAAVDRLQKPSQSSQDEKDSNQTTILELRGNDMEISESEIDRQFREKMSEKNRSSSPGKRESFLKKDEEPKSAPPVPAKTHGSHFTDDEPIYENSSLNDAPQEESATSRQNSQENSQKPKVAPKPSKPAVAAKPKSSTISPTAVAPQRKVANLITEKITASGVPVMSGGTENNELMAKLAARKAKDGTQDSRLTPPPTSAKPNRRDGRG